MKKVIIASFLMLVLVKMGNAQSNDNQKLICDETYISNSKTTFKIISSNYFIPGKLIEKYGVKSKGWNVKPKKDRAGEYFEYSFTFPASLRKEIETFLVNLKRPEDNARITVDQFVRELVAASAWAEYKKNKN